MSAPTVTIALPSRAREALAMAARAVADAERSQSDLLAGLLLAAAPDVDLAAVARWALTPEGIALTLATPAE